MLAGVETVLARPRPYVAAEVGPALGVVLDGCPPGIPLREKDIQTGDYNIHWLEHWLETNLGDG